MRVKQPIFIGLTIIILLSFIAATIAYILLDSSTATTAEHVHWHAGFQVYVDGNLQDFGEWQYMHFEPCAVDQANKAKDIRLEDKIHLHDLVSDVTHIHYAGVTWRDLFSSIGFEIPTGEAVFVLNGKRVEDLLGREVNNEDSATFLFGDSEGLQFDQIAKNQITISRIQEVELMSESCGSL